MNNSELRIVVAETRADMHEDTLRFTFTTCLTRSQTVCRVMHERWKLYIPQIIFLWRN